MSHPHRITKAEKQRVRDHLNQYAAPRQSKGGGLPKRDHPIVRAVHDAISELAQNDREYVTSREVAAYLGDSVSPHNAGRSLARLAEDGLVERETQSSPVTWRLNV